MDPASLIFLVLLFGLFYFLLIRPQRKRVEDHRRLVESIEAGDEVVTIGGLYGTVSAIGDEHMELEVAAGVRLRYAKQAIARRVVEKLDAPASDDELPGTAPEGAVTKAISSGAARSGGASRRKPAKAGSAPARRTTSAKKTTTRAASAGRRSGTRATGSQKKK